MSNKTPIFIVGSSRSGTTLLQMIINSHPDLAIYGEVHYFDEIVKLFDKEDSFNTTKDIEYFFEVQLKRAYHVRLLPKFDLVIQRVKEKLLSGDASKSDIYRLIIESYAELESKRRYGDKTNEHIRYVEELLTLFPDAKIIHIIRDARDVVSSMISMPWASNDILANTLRWRAEISYIQRCVDDKSHIYEVRYEDLIKNPEKICRGLCGFIEEPFAPEMLEYYKKSNNYIVDEPWKNKTSVSLNMDAMQKWKRELSRLQACAIQLMVGKLLKKYNYEIVNYGILFHVAIPYVLFVEVIKYIKYKGVQKGQRGQEEEGADADIIYGDDKRLHKLLFKSFF